MSGIDGFEIKKLIIHNKSINKPINKIILNSTEQLCRPFCIIWSQ